MRIYPFEEEKMTNRILRAIEEELRHNNRHYFSYVWREKIKNELKADSKYQKLLDWINNEIFLNLSIVNVINPAEGVTECWDNYCMKMGKIAALIHMREILLFQTCTDEMRGNIEKDLCKNMGIRYWEQAGDYFPIGAKEDADNGQ